MPLSYSLVVMSSFMEERQVQPVESAVTSTLRRMRGKLHRVARDKDISRDAL
jgi:hypothetical protein